jgi:hypothetical protein
MGDTKMNDLEYATYFDGKKVDLIDREYIDIVYAFASGLNFLPSDLYIGDSPTGPNGWNRTWVKNSANA